MAIALDRGFRGQFRFINMSKKMGKHRALGLCMDFWELASQFDGFLVPREAFAEWKLPDALVTHGFAYPTEKGFLAVDLAKPDSGVSVVAANQQPLITRTMPDAEPDQPALIGGFYPGGHRGQNPDSPGIIKNPQKKFTRASSLSSSNTEEEEEEEEEERSLTPGKRLAKIWNDHCGKLPKVLEVNRSREAQARNRWKECGDEKIWIAVVTKIAGLAFCNGDNERGWRADFEWMLRPNTRLRVLENKYASKDDTYQQGFKLSTPEDLKAFEDRMARGEG